MFAHNREMRAHAYNRKPLVDTAQSGIDGALLVLSPLPLMFGISAVGIVNNFWIFTLALGATLSCLISALLFFRKPRIAKVLGAIAASATYLAALPAIVNNQILALVANIIVISALFNLIEIPLVFRRKRQSLKLQTDTIKCRIAWYAVPIVLIIYLISAPNHQYADYVLISSISIAFLLFLKYTISKNSISLSTLAVSAWLTGLILYFYAGENVYVTLTLFYMIAILSYIPSNSLADRHSTWWEFFLNHPARILISTFLTLCVIGTILLCLPLSLKDGIISVIDATFIAVSASCVTGLAVFDTSSKFSIFGQFVILLLIQLGGLGILSITAVTLDIVGRRISLRQERVLTSMTDTDHNELLSSLKEVLKLTFIIEGLGALILSLLFYIKGDSLLHGIGRAIFTSISAFCNAGFSLQTDSLIPYQSDPLILYTVSALIILGGIAPATVLVIPKWIRGKKVPVQSHLALLITIILLIISTFLLLAFEWNSSLNNLSISDKIHNGWFQAVTLRTAGFNSIEISNVTDTSLMVMILMMLIGGSPGGTAGGVKTTTLGVIAMTFWSVVMRQENVVSKGRTISKETVYRAITIIFAGMIVWITIVIMLMLTQNIDSKGLIFEATSALGTVGLTTGATNQLDEIGKIIIIIAMFIGRIGPITLFMLLGTEYQNSIAYPQEKVSLT